jgi:lipoprotein-anchoring transpeptidase ErfK/SrfK
MARERMMHVRGIIAAVSAAGMAFTLLVVPPQALGGPIGTSSTTIAAPTVTGVIPGQVEGQVTVNFTAVDGASGYQYSVNSGLSWLPCLDSGTTCTLQGLPTGQIVFVWLRATTPSGFGDVAAFEVTAQTPGSQELSPAPLPKPRVWATAKFNAASNSLGVDGSKVKLGVGTLPQLRFSRPITDKAAVERGLRVTATSKQGLTRRIRGAWGWLDDQRVVFRPVQWWPAHSTITVTSTLGRQVLGRSSDKKYVVGRDQLNGEYTFRTGRKFIATVNGATKKMVVKIDNQVKKTFPVSLGKPGWETRNGPKIVSTAKEPYKVYTSQAIGITDPAQAYRLEAPWNVRLTPTGEFVHTAHWAYGRLGRYNGSHGCTNMREEDAKWIYDQTVPGDVIDYKNTGGSYVESWNGPGGLWNIPWATWLKKSALGNPSGIPDTQKDPGSVATAPPVGA